MTERLDALLALSRRTQRELERAPIDRSAVATDIAAELRAALANLLGNAWKFTRPRRIAHIELGVASVRGTPVLFVRDDGVGFPPGADERLFRPFALRRSLANVSLGQRGPPWPWL